MLQQTEYTARALSAPSPQPHRFKVLRRVLTGEFLLRRFFFFARVDFGTRGDGLPLPTASTRPTRPSTPIYRSSKISTWFTPLTRVSSGP